MRHGEPQSVDDGLEGSRVGMPSKIRAQSDPHLLGRESISEQQRGGMVRDGRECAREDGSMLGICRGGGRYEESRVIRVGANEGVNVSRRGYKYRRGGGGEAAEEAILDVHELDARSSGPNLTILGDDITSMARSGATRTAGHPLAGVH